MLDLDFGVLVLEHRSGDEGISTMRGAWVVMGPNKSALRGAH